MKTDTGFVSVVLKGGDY